MRPTLPAIAGLGAYATIGAQLSAAFQGPDGYAWLMDPYSSEIMRVNITGGTMSYATTTAASWCGCCGPDARAWTMQGTAVKAWTAALVSTAYTTTATGAVGCCTGPDGRIWSVDGSSNVITAITTAGVATNYTMPTTSWSGVCSDGTNLWAVSPYYAGVVKVTTSGTTTSYPTSSAYCAGGIVFNPSDGNLYAVAGATDYIYRFTTAGVATQSAAAYYSLSSSSMGLVIAGDGYLHVVGTGTGGIWFRFSMSSPTMTSTMMSPVSIEDYPTTAVTTDSLGNLYVTTNAPGGTNANFMPVQMVGINLPMNINQSVKRASFR